MKIERINQTTLPLAAAIHAAAWQASHRTICSPEFVAQHTAKRQQVMLHGEMEKGKRLYLLTDERPVGLVSVCGSLIEHLYVLPEEQGKGYGTALLRFALAQCEDAPVLWCLNTNRLALDWYQRVGFVPTGRRNNFTGTLWELELRRG